MKRAEVPAWLASPPWHRGRGAATPVSSAVLVAFNLSGH
jgi:hypothetical protein